LEIPEDAELGDAAVSYWVAWHSLSSDRPMGAMGGAGRIPWSVIDRYAEKNLFDDTDQLARMLWAMDDVYLSWMAEQSKRRTLDK
jgi:hypothetical protein